MQYDVWRIHHGTINTQNNWKKVCQNIIIVVVGAMHYELKRGKNCNLAGQYALFASKTKINDFWNFFRGKGAERGPNGDPEWKHYLLKYFTLLAHCGMVSTSWIDTQSWLMSHHNNNWESSHDRSKPMLLLITEKGVVKSKIAIFFSTWCCLDYSAIYL